MKDALQAAKSEPTEGSPGYRSGHYGTSLITRTEKLELRVPQSGRVGFQWMYLNAISAARRHLTALAEMHIQGVLTHKVKNITEELFGHRFSVSAVKSCIHTFFSYILTAAYAGVNVPSRPERRAKRP